MNRPLFALVVAFALFAVVSVARGGGAPYVQPIQGAPNGTPVGVGGVPVKSGTATLTAVGDQGPVLLGLTAGQLVTVVPSNPVGFGFGTACQTSSDNGVTWNGPSCGSWQNSQAEFVQTVFVPPGVSAVQIVGAGFYNSGATIDVTLYTNTASAATALLIQNSDGTWSPLGASGLTVTPANGSMSVRQASAAGYYSGQGIPPIAGTLAPSSGAVQVCPPTSGPYPYLQYYSYFKYVVQNQGDPTTGIASGSNMRCGQTPDVGTGNGRIIVPGRDYDAPQFWAGPVFCANDGANAVAYECEMYPVP